MSDLSACLTCACLPYSWQQFQSTMLQKEDCFQYTKRYNTGLGDSCKRVMGCRASSRPRGRRSRRGLQASRLRAHRGRRSRSSHTCSSSHLRQNAPGTASPELPLHGMCTLGKGRHRAVLQPVLWTSAFMCRLPLPKETTTSIDDALKAAEWLTEEELQQEQQKIFASWARVTFRSIPGRP